MRRNQYYIEEALSIPDITSEWKAELKQMQNPEEPTKKKPKKSEVSMTFNGNVDTVITKQKVTGGQTNNFGNTTHIHGDKVHGDQVQVDKIQGDKIVHNYNYAKDKGELPQDTNPIKDIIASGTKQADISKEDIEFMRSLKNNPPAPTPEAVKAMREHFNNLQKK